MADQHFFIFKWDYLTYEKFLISLKNSQLFREEIIKLFKSFNKFKQVYWEFPPYSIHSKNNIAEFVLVKAPPFANADSSHFKDYLRHNGCDETIDFLNLSGDATLIIPSHNSSKSKYSGHIMDFIKNGSDEQIHNLLEHTAKLMLTHTDSQNKVYLSTHGRGVPLQLVTKT